MLNKIPLFKGLAAASISLMMVAVPLSLPVALGQVIPATSETIPADLEKLLQQGDKQISEKQTDAALAAFLEVWNQAKQRNLKQVEITAILRIRKLYSDLKQPEKALDAFRSVLIFYGNSNNREMEAFVLSAIASIYNDELRQPEKALEYYNQVLSIYRNLKLRQEEASILKSIAAIYNQKLNLPKQALEYYNQALAVYREIKDRKQEANTLEKIASFHSDQKQPGRSLEYYNQALAIYRQLKDRKEEARMNSIIGQFYIQQQQYGKALEYYNRNLSIYQEIRDQLGESIALGDIGYIYDDIGYIYEKAGEIQKALKYYNQQLAVYESSEKLSPSPTRRERVCALYSANGMSQEALDCYNKLLVFYRKDTSYRTQEASILSDIGSLYNLIGKNKESLEYYNQALAIYRELSNHLEEAKVCTNIAYVYSSRGELQKALDYYTQSLTILRELKAQVQNALEPSKKNQDLRITEILTQEATLFVSMGSLYSDIGDQARALEYYNQAMKRAGEAKKPLIHRIFNSSVILPYLAELQTLVGTGQAYFRMGQYQKALEHYNQALVIGRDLKTKVPELKSAKLYEALEGSALSYSGEVYARLGQQQKALDYYNQALPIFRNTRFALGEGITLSYMGQAYYRMGQPQDALRHYNQALPVFRTVQYRRGEAELLYSFARLSREKGDLSKALEQIGTAIQLVETTRGEIQSTELRTTYLASVQDYYKLQIDILMQLHKQDPSKGYDQQALQASERARARGLNDLLNEARIDIREGADPTLLAQERDLLAQLRNIATQRAKLSEKPLSAEQLAQFERDYNALQQQYQQNQAQIRATSPRYANLRQPNPLSAKEIQSLLDDDTLLLNYSLGTDRSYFWLISRNGVTSYELPKAKEIGDLVRRYYSLLTDKDVLTFKKAELEQVGQQLSRMLLGPVANQLGQKRLVVVADGALFYLPFAALPLPNSQQFLLTQHEIVHLPSATTLALLRQDNNRRTAPKTIALMADPVFGKDDPRLRSVRPPQVVAQAPTPLRFVTRGDTLLARLPYTAVEAQNILRLAPATQQQAWLGFAANLQNATSPQLAEYQIVHFATHGIFNSQNPERSGLIFSRLTPNGTFQNSDLTLQEIFNLKLKADLVVLSACQTGLGQSIENVQDIQGEGLVGLTRGFMYAGTPRVLVSLWSVNDQSTATLMSQFYQNKLAKGMTAAAALRQAQLEMLKNPQYQSPFYWAPFILQGEWR